MCNTSTSFTSALQTPYDTLYYLAPCRHKLPKALNFFLNSFSISKYVELFWNRLWPHTASSLSLLIDRLLGYTNLVLFISVTIFIYTVPGMDAGIWHTCAPKTRKFILHTLLHANPYHMWGGRRLVAYEDDAFIQISFAEYLINFDCQRGKRLRIINMHSYNI